jgi:hypothetical protein
MAFQLDKDGAALCAGCCYTLCRLGTSPEGYPVMRLTAWPPAGVANIFPRLRIIRHTHGLEFVSFSLCRVPFLAVLFQKKAPKMKKTVTGKQFCCLPNCVTSHKICQSFAKDSTTLSPSLLARYLTRNVIQQYNSFNVETIFGRPCFSRANPQLLLLLLLYR